ncbi:Extracellular serine protease [Marinobacter nauticus]|uniref:Extracellular serine protease n=1 Tax=Marinobacter nauticus TaxID=2743 RepID=A0A833NAH8_MARNT|nr:Extracellular serine protease [Marinobacter nauticus]
MSGRILGKQFQQKIKREAVRLSILAFVLVPGMALLTGCGGGSGGSDADEPITPPSPLSGVISIEANSRVDQDTMDQLGLEGAIPAPGSQRLPDNFVLAGYVSGSSGTYPPNQSDCQPLFYSADSNDTFTVPLAPGETLVLQSFGSCVGDPALELEFDSQFVGTASIGSSVVLTSFTETRDYTVRITNQNSEPARYILAKTVSMTSDGLSFEWPDHEFAEDRALITMSGDQGRQMALTSSQGITPRHLGGESWLLTRAAPASVNTNANQRKHETLNWIRDLRTQSGFAQVQPDYLFSRQAGTPISEPFYPRQWHYGLINGPAAWQLVPDGGAGVNVAVLDTGILRLNSGQWHPDLNDNIVAGRDFVDNDSNPVDPGNSIGGDVFHGTHVAGTIGAVVDGNGIGGIAYGAGIIPVRVLGEGGTGSASDLIAAINWVVNEGVADVVNMSLGGLPQIPQLESALQKGVEKDVLFVAAAGNSSTSVKSYPAASPYVLAVSAVDGAGNLAGYSNFGSWIDLAAPGGDASRDGNLDGSSDVVWSTSGEVTATGPRAGYLGLQGTSMASPHVAGVVALMKEVSPGINHAQVIQALRNGELTDYSGSRSDALGYGVIDAAKAVSAASSTFDQTVLSASPAVVSLSSEGQDQQRIDLNVFGDDEVSGISVSSLPDWLSVVADNLDSRPYSLTLALLRDRLVAGEAAKGTIEISYSVNGSAETLSIPAIGQLISDQEARNAGRHFVLLVNTEPDARGFYLAESQVVVDAESGQYPFRFEFDDGEEPRRLSEVRPGDYYLVAGTDHDGDGLICQPGEACAEYPVAGLREIVSITDESSLSDIRMTTSFSRPTISESTPDILPRPGFKGYKLLETGTAPSTNDGVKAVR